MLRKLAGNPLRGANLSPIAANFCIYKAYLDPSKHIYMTHNPHNMFEDLFSYGQYPLPTVPMQRQLKRDYIPKIASIVFAAAKRSNVPRGL